MLDTRFLEALAAVVEEGGFDKGARRLHITQSAVSQRIRNLEEQLGQVLVVRSVPPEPTEAGQKLIMHLRQLQMMEHELGESLGLKPAGEFVTLPLGVNADTLATWFLDAMDEFLRENKILPDIYVDDENRTYEMLKNGEVVGCIGTGAGALKNCRSEYLATFDYLCLSTADFYEQWFRDGFTSETVCRAPTALFNRKDETQGRMFEKLFPGEKLVYPVCFVPSSEAFVDVLRRGLAYGMAPEFQVAEELAAGTLIEVIPQGRVPVSLYWHSWNVETRLLNDLRNALVGYFSKESSSKNNNI
ncbi:LysR family transcriptional regulator ArgP [Maridesulfovibrio sp.]|uniref:LysR family transcriptional regulator ArgP n=1 Tax=Maridesulfovibrio sp. TaxID=2795000 RepID=UPI002A188713|nr:LysR family transcriptional regulator ArgP [Maridesulfovibrio sp.]